MESVFVYAWRSGESRRQERPLRLRCFQWPVLKQTRSLLGRRPPMRDWPRLPITSMRSKIVLRTMVKTIRAAGARALRRRRQLRRNQVAAYPLHYSRKPRDGQNLAGLTGYAPSPTKHSRGLLHSSEEWVRHSGYQGWFFAVQIQGNLSGDLYASVWTATQTKAFSGTFSIQSIYGATTTIIGSVAATPDNPSIGINTSTKGRFDWLDAPGVPYYQKVGA